MLTFGTVIFVILVIVVLSAIKVKPGSTDSGSSSGEMTEARRRELRRAARRGEKPTSLPWMGNPKKRRKKKYFWDD